MVAPLKTYLAGYLLLLAALLIPLDALGHVVAPQSCLAQSCPLVDHADVGNQACPEEGQPSPTVPDDRPCGDECPDCCNDLAPPHPAILVQWAGQEGALGGRELGLSLPDLPHVIDVPPQNVSPADQYRNNHHWKEITSCSQLQIPEYGPSPTFSPPYA